MAEAQWKNCDDRKGVALIELVLRRRCLAMVGIIRCDAGWHHRHPQNSLRVSPEDAAAARKHLWERKLSDSIEPIPQALKIKYDYGSAADVPEGAPHVKLDKRVGTGSRRRCNEDGTFRISPLTTA
jgi:hypothetical protein